MKGTQRRISGLKGRIIELNKQINKHSLRDLWDYHKRFNFMSLESQKERKKGEGGRAEKVLEEIMAENFPNPSEPQTG